MNFVVLSSSRGTTFKAVTDRIADGSLTATCLGLVTDSEDRGCIGVAKEAGLPMKIVKKEKGEEREAFDKRVHAAIEELGQADVIAALGWMWLLSPWFVHEWRNRIVNVHPALLPKYPGAHAIRDALAAGATETGMTIHFIDEGVDTGPIIDQQHCTVDEDETEESLKKKIQTLEKEWYPKVLQRIETGEIQLPVIEERMQKDVQQEGGKNTESRSMNYEE